MSSESEIRSFRVDMPGEAIADLRRRMPRRAGPAGSWSPTGRRGAAGDDPGARPLLATEYDWRACEARPNALPQFTTEIDGEDVHFIHVKSPHTGALPLIITHGWPGSVLELLEVIGPLTDLTAHGGSAADAFDVVLPSVPGYGFSAEPAQAAGTSAASPERGRSSYAASAMTATPPRAATWARPSPTRWAARRPRGWPAST